MTRRLEEGVLALQTKKPDLTEAKAREQAANELQKLYDESKTISNTSVLK